jgi:hypothetical protein
VLVDCLLDNDAVLTELDLSRNALGGPAGAALAVQLLGDPLGAVSQTVAVPQAEPLMTPLA